MKTIDEKELKRLRDIEAQWEALEAGGVDNWYFYDEAMAPYWEMKKVEEAYEDLAQDILDVAGEGVDTLLELLKKRVPLIRH